MLRVFGSLSFLLGLDFLCRVVSGYEVFRMNAGAQFSWQNYSKGFHGCCGMARGWQLLGMS